MSFESEVFFYGLFILEVTTSSDMFGVYFATGIITSLKGKLLGMLIMQIIGYKFYNLIWSFPALPFYPSYNLPRYYLIYSIQLLLLSEHVISWWHDRGNCDRQILTIWQLWYHVRDPTWSVIYRWLRMVFLLRSRWGKSKSATGDQLGSKSTTSEEWIGTVLL